MPARRPPNPRTKPSAERRNDLMAAAERLFLEKGFERTSVEDITAAADVAKGTFYLQFACKADVVEALRARFVQRLLDGAVAAAAAQPAGDWPGRLAAWVRACAAGYLDAAPVHHLVFVAVPPPTREGLARNDLIDDLAALLSSGAGGGAWALEDPRFTAAFLFNAIHGLVNGVPSMADAARTRLLDAIEAHAFRVVAWRAAVASRSAPQPIRHRPLRKCSSTSPTCRNR